MDLPERVAFLQPALTKAGFVLDEIQDSLTYGERDAWAVYYRGPECKLQLYWSDRTGSLNWMMAPLDAPNEFGLENRSAKWKYLLMLSDVQDNLDTPDAGADAITDMVWLQSLFAIHYRSAVEKLARSAKN